MLFKSIYEYRDYKKFFNEWVERQARKGHGEYRRVALSLQVSTTMISQIFKGDKHLSLELAQELAEYLELKEDEGDYFLLLVQYQKAGSVKLQARLLKQIDDRQTKARKLENRIKANKEMPEQVKNIFYSGWAYSATRLMADVEKMDNAAVIAEYLRLPRNQVQKVLDFLLEHQLVIEEKGKLKIGPARTFIGSSSFMTLKHHQNWRVQAMGLMNTTDDDNFFYTGPMTLSHGVAAKIRQELPGFIEKIHADILPSKSETLRCLNIDWFGF
jgi:uncharacterized protein (TIGR02147 family)